MQMVDSIGRAVRHPRESVGRWRLRSKGFGRAAVVGLMLAATIGTVAIVPSWQTDDRATGELLPKLTLTEQQRQILFDEANERYRLALEKRDSAPDEAASLFEQAARKYQMLVDAGTQNFFLYVNLGNAWLNAGKPGRAIANYRRAQRLRPLDAQVRNNLEWALRRAKPNDASEPHLGWSGSDAWNTLSRLPTRYWIVPLWSGWLGLWLAWIGRSWWPRFPSRLVVVPAVLLVLVVASL